MKLFNKIVAFSITFLIVSCFSVETKNAEKAYKYWSGSEVPKEIELIKGEYYQSPHFSLEYELFLKFKTDKKWFDEFIVNNQLEVGSIRNDWSAWTKLPEWFNTDNSYIIYTKDQIDKFEKSRYFYNPQNGISFIYETVGM